MEIVIAVLAIAVFLLYKKVNSSPSPSSGQVGVVITTPTSVLSSIPQNALNISPSLQPQPPLLPTTKVLPYLNPNAILLTDSEIAQMELTYIGSSLVSASDKARFSSEVVTDALENEIISYPALNNQCSSGMQYQGPPVGLTIAKDGSLALSFAGSAGAALGGAFGSAAGFAGTGFAAAGTALGTAIPIAGIAIGLGISIYSAIAAHHQAAVNREQGLECSLIPPANKSLEVIDNAVYSGIITPAQGKSALVQLVTDFTTAATGGLGGLKDSPGSLNAMGWYKHFLHAITIKKSNKYDNLVTN